MEISEKSPAIPLQTPPTLLLDSNNSTVTKKTTDLVLNRVEIYFFHPDENQLRNKLREQKNLDFLSPYFDAIIADLRQQKNDYDRIDTIARKYTCSKDSKIANMQELLEKTEDVTAALIRCSFIKHLMYPSVSSKA